MKFLILAIIDIAFIARVVRMMKANEMRCHKRKDRCLPLIRNKSWRICTRCLFMYIGIGLFPVIYLLLNWWQLSIFVSLGLGTVFQIPMLVDGFTQHQTKRMSNNWLRASTGLISGLGLSVVICSVLLLGGY